MAKQEKHVIFFILFIIFMVAMLVSGVFIDEKLFPALTEISLIKAQEIANKCIDDAVKDTLNNMQINYDDLFINNKETEIFSVNTVLVNRFVVELNKNITKTFDTFEEITISVPLGAASGVSGFSDFGPTVDYDVTPYGEVKTDYETEVTQAGFSRTSVKVWINAEVGIKVMHPIIEKKVVISRKIMLVDMILKGDVPDSILYQS